MTAAACALRSFVTENARVARKILVIFAVFCTYFCCTSRNSQELCTNFEELCRNFVGTWPNLVELSPNRAELLGTTRACSAVFAVMLSYAEVTKRCAIESLKYKALHASGATGAVRLSVFVACGLASEMCGPVAQAYAFRVCARWSMSNMDARAAPGNFGEFWRTLAVFYTSFSRI